MDSKKGNGNGICGKEIEMEKGNGRANSAGKGNGERNGGTEEVLAEKGRKR
jgi:hypothetical protein